MFTLPREDVFKAFQNRQSIRRYNPNKKISQDDFRFILELGRLSPSSVGSEPWRFLVIQNPELRAQMKPIAWGMAGALDDASHVVAIIARRGLTYDSDAAKFSKNNLPPHWKNTACSKTTAWNWPATPAPCLTGHANKPTSHWPT